MQESPLDTWPALLTTVSLVLPGPWHFHLSFCRLFIIGPSPLRMLTLPLRERTNFFLQGFVKVLNFYCCEPELGSFWSGTYTQPCFFVSLLRCFGWISATVFWLNVQLIWQKLFLVKYSVMSERGSLLTSTYTAAENRRRSLKRRRGKCTLDRAADDIDAEDF